MRQVVRFHHPASIKGFTFEANKQYVFEIKTVGVEKGVYFQDTLLGQIDCFQNQYVETHCVSWLDYGRIYKKPAA